MYDPIQDGIEKNTSSVIYRETKPPQEFTDLVHGYWELKTQVPLAEDFFLHALPDACVNILFNQKDTQIAGVTALQTTYEKLNLGKDFSYAGIQFFPGAWLGDQDETTDKFVGEAYLGDLPLVKTSNALSEVEFDAKTPIFSEFSSIKSAKRNSNLPRIVWLISRHAGSFNVRFAAVTARSISSGDAQSNVDQI